ncbi:MAG: YkgJ family cysteine cluster protein [Promethearchaeota archaeon]|nr:MAG: YkgJ family cysteine cluster protein [Candidatus Lokiarchaeota archaeon]
MEESRELRFKCTRCGNCCMDINTVVNVTYHDILRIKNALDLSLEEIIEVLGFYVFEHEPTEEERKKMVVPPIETERGPAFVGLRKIKYGEGYRCYFYNPEEKRCLIYGARPNFCKTFPFTFRILFNKEDPTKAKIKMDYTDKAIEYCPGIGEEAPDIDEVKWILVGKETIEQMQDDKVLITKWNEAVKAGEIEPSVKNYLITLLNLEDQGEDN